MVKRMATRHSKKTEQRYDVFGHVGAVVSDPDASRAAKIAALRHYGSDVSSKTNSKRVNAKLQTAFDEILSIVKGDDEKRNARNRRKRARKMRGLR